MITVCFLALLNSVYAISEAETNTINGWITQPILSPNEFQNQLQQFIKSYIPPLEVPQTAEEWTKKSDELRQEILDKVVYRGVPKEWYEKMPQIVWGDTIETDKGYVIRKLRYEALPGLWIPALLYEPTKMNDKIPAVLNVNGHVGPPGKTQDYEQIRCINLAKRGVLALHPEWLVFGELSSEDYKHNRLAYLDLCGACGVSVFFLAIKRGIDVLVMHQNADTEKIAMTGLSGGGWQTIFLSSLDTRITASAPTAGYIGLDYRADFIEDTGDVEQNPNDLLTIADYSHLTAMLAPRPTLLIYNEKDDCCFQTHRARPSVYEPIIPFFELFGKSDDFALHNNKVPGTHNYDKDNREQLYKFINKYFLADSETMDNEIPSDDEVLSYDDLIVGIPDDNANFYTLAMEMMKEFPKNRPPKGNISQWQKDGRDTLRNILKNKPMTAQANKIAEVSEGNLKSKHYKVSVNGFTIPLVAISNSEKCGNSIVLIFSDKGKSTLIEQVKSEVEKGSTVIVIDPIFMGECMPVKGPVWQYTQMVSTIGERALGLQAGQIGAVIEWTCQEFKCDRVSLYGVGWNASLVAILACALSNERIESVSVKDHLPSLKMLIENHLDYETHPVFFCFGLLEQFDVEEFIALCSPVTVNII
jgi:dienelactone hydrolase